MNSWGWHLGLSKARQRETKLLEIALGTVDGMPERAYEGLSKGTLLGILDGMLLDAPAPLDFI